MPVVVVRPVGMFKAKFRGIEVCKNADYSNILLELEYDRNEKFKPEKHLHEADEVVRFAHLVPGKDYMFKCAVGINGESKKEGKFYPARMNLKILDAKELV